LAIAFGATTGIFSVVNAVLLRELPFREPDRIVDIFQAPVRSLTAMAQFRDNLSESRDYLDDNAIYVTTLLNVERQGLGSRLRVTETSANFFELLGTKPAIGRTFSSEELEPAGSQVAVLSHRVWLQNFGGDTSVIGTQLTLNGLPFTIIGIASPAMDFPYKTDVWTATGLDVERIPKGAYGVDAIGRLKTGLSLKQARAAFETSIRRKDPKAFDTVEQTKPHLNPLRDELARDIREASLILFGTVASILLIACANVAQLLLARLNERRQELTIRAALGASTGRITQQLITEALVLTTIAVVAGMTVARWTTQLVSQVAPAALAVQEYTLLDARVLAFAVGIALLCALLFGAMPAALIRRLKPSTELSGSRTGATSSAGRVRMVLTAVQAALTILLLAGSASLGRTFLKMLDTNLGFDTSQVLTFQVSLEGSRYKEKAMSPFYSEVASRLRAIPGVEAAGPSLYVPLQLYPNVQAFTLTLENGKKSPARRNLIGAGFFAAMKQVLVAGRDFTDAERFGSENAVIVNEEIARSSGLGADIVGHRTQGAEPATIVGVVRTARWEGPDIPPWNEWYTPLERSQPSFAAFAVRVRGDASSYIPAVRNAVQSVDPAVPVYRVEPLKALLDERLARPRFYTTAISFLGGFALLLSAIGIYGVAFNSVAQRTKEIGIRIAVGASVSGVRAMLLRQTMLPLLAGLAIGMTGAIALGTYLQNLMYSAEPVGVAVTAATAGMLILCCAVAVWRATARIVRIDPMQALRAE